MGLPWDAIEWMRSRPPVVQALMRRFPPSCYVQTRVGVHLRIPGAGRTGQLASYMEDGMVTVVDHEMQMRAVCDPDDLVIVGYWNDVTPDAVAAVLDSAVPDA